MLLKDSGRAVPPHTGPLRRRGRPDTRDLPDLSGNGIDRFRLGRRLGGGHTGVVYLATDDYRRSVALKVLHPDRVRLPDFHERLEADIRKLSEISHPHILPVYQFGTSEDGYTYVAMAMAARGTLKLLLDRGALDPGRAQQVLEAVAHALHSAHESGVVHHDVKVSNVLFDSSGRVLLADFGTPRTSYGLLGTPGYIAPEQVLGLQLDRRVDVYALGVLAFEMLTGRSPFRRSSPTETILATVQEPVPPASPYNPRLGEEVDVVLARALAKVPEERYATTTDFVRDLGQVPPFGRLRQSFRTSGQPAAAPGLPALTDGRSNQEDPFERSVVKLEEILNGAPTASVMVDEANFIVGWNGVAEQTFGWSRDEILGRSLVPALIPPRYRELHERGLHQYLATGEGPVLGKKLELSALHKDGREVAIELSITEEVRSRSGTRILASMQDISQERLRKRMAVLHSSLTAAVEEGGSLQAAAQPILETVGEQLDCSVATLWVHGDDGQALLCAGVWHDDGVDCVRLTETTLTAAFTKDDGVPGQVWARARPLWFGDFVTGEDSPRVMAALRSGLRTVVGMPILQAQQVRGVVELFSIGVRREDQLLLDSLYVLGQHLGHALSPA